MPNDLWYQPGHSYKVGDIVSFAGRGSWWSRLLVAMRLRKPPIKLFRVTSVDHGTIEFEPVTDSPKAP